MAQLRATIGAPVERLRAACKAILAEPVGEAEDRDLMDKRGQAEGRFIVSEHYSLTSREMAEDPRQRRIYRFAVWHS